MRKYPPGQETFFEAQGKVMKITSSWHSDWCEISQTTFFVAYSRLCCHCRNLANGGTLVAISFYPLLLLFGSHRLSEFTLAGPSVNSSPIHDYFTWTIMLNLLIK